MTVESEKECPICNNASEFAWRIKAVETDTKQNNNKLDKLLWGVMANLIGIVGILGKIVISG